MDDKIIAIFCLCDDLLQAMHHPEDVNANDRCRSHDDGLHGCFILSRQSGECPCMLKQTAILFTW